METQRRESEVLPTHENFEEDEEGDGQIEMTARKMLSSNDRTADLTGRSDIRPDDEDDKWMTALKDSGQKRDNEEQEEYEYDEEEGEGEDYQYYSENQSGSQVDYEDDQVHRTDPYFGGGEQ